MQNIKNFRLVELAPELMDYMPYLAEGLHLESEDGRDWYAWQSAFSDDTIKIMYDENGVIRSVVDKPVPQRGNVYAVSMFFPNGFSVAEISQADWPKDFNLDGSWRFDGETVYQDMEIVNAKAINSNTAKLNAEKQRATSEIILLQTLSATGNASKKQTQTLTLWTDYLVQLSKITDLINPDWPPSPI